MPSQADEEAHQLSYLQKHLANILSLLAEPVEGEGEGEESLVCETYASFFCYFCLFYLVHTKLYAVQVDFSATMFHFSFFTFVNCFLPPNSTQNFDLSQDPDPILLVGATSICINDAQGFSDTGVLIPDLQQHHTNWSNGILAFQN